MSIKQVKPGIFVRHHSGRIYRVLHIANSSAPETEKFPHCVVYQNVDTGAVWLRPIRDWVQKFDFIASAGWLWKIRGMIRRGVSVARR